MDDCRALWRCWGAAQRCQPHCNPCWACLNLGFEGQSAQTTKRLQGWVGGRNSTWRGRLATPAPTASRDSPVTNHRREQEQRPGPSLFSVKHWHCSSRAQKCLTPASAWACCPAAPLPAPPWSLQPPPVVAARPAAAPPAVSAAARSRALLPAPALLCEQRPAAPPPPFASAAAA